MRLRLGLYAVILEPVRRVLRLGNRSEGAMLVSVDVAVTGSPEGVDMERRRSLSGRISTIVAVGDEPVDSV